MKGSYLSTRNKQDPKLVGEVNEANIKLDNVDTKALLDTGSCVSLIAETFYKNNLSHIDIEPLTDVLNVECADGQQLPYIGCIEVEVSIETGLDRAKPQPCIFLISSDTRYSAGTPVVLGTNILHTLLQDCKDNFGDQFLQKAKLHTPWYLSFRAISLQKKLLKRNKDRVAIVRSAVLQKIILRPNETKNIRAYVDKKVYYPNVNVMMHETAEANLPDYIDIEPTLVKYDYDNNRDLIVTLSNITTNTVCIPPRAILCELQPVTITEEVMKRKEEEEMDRKREAVVSELNIDDNNLLTDEQKETLTEFLLGHKDIFSTGDTDIGECNKVKHRIDLVDAIPFKLRHRRIPPTMIDEVRQHLEQLHSGGIIRPSKSPYASPIVLCRKKNGKLRMCVDYRTLNQKTIKDSFALPRMEEIFDTLTGSRYFSTVDMKSGYHQVELEEAHKEKTAFTLGPYGLWEFNKLAFGLTNSPATYQRLMQECLGDLNMQICVVYIDDLIIFSKTFEEHLENLEKVFQRLKSFNLKLAPEKCQFFRKQIPFLGHVVSEEGIETDPAKIDKVRNWPSPSKAEELRSFLAFAGYYRRFIKDFSKISRPLADLLPPTSTKRGPKKKPLKEWKWTEQEQKAFDNLKVTLSSPPILAYPNFEIPFELHTDASTKGLGAVLYQQQGDTKRVIAFASRAVSKAEQNYSAFRLEYLALKWAITEKFSDYLTNNHFSVLTDSNPLTYILTSAKLDATGQRWASALGQYNFDISYRSGLRNADADGMSRYPHEKITLGEETAIKIDNSTIRAICCCLRPPYFEVLTANSINIIEATEDPSKPIAQIEMREIRNKQREDRLIDRWRIAAIDNCMPTNNLTKQDMIMKRQFKTLKIKRGILFRTVTENDETIEQLVLPHCYREQVLHGLHNDVGHPGRDRTMRLVRQRFYWPGMTTDVEKLIVNCDRCLRRKSPTSNRAPLVNVHTTFPLELVCLDFLTLEPAKGGIANVLVITDHYTKFAMAIPTKNQTAKTTAESFYNEFIVHYGIPTRLHSDQGANFEAEIMKELCALTNMKKSHTSIYHPQGNAGPERFNRTLLNMLGTLEGTQKPDWKRYVSSLVYAYNCTPHESTKVSPFELMFGRKPRLPIDSVFEQARKPVNKSSSEYIEDLRERMLKTRQIVQEHVSKAKARQKKYYDFKARAAKIIPGDKVLVKILAFDTKHKISDKFEEELYTVMEQVKEDIPVYKLRGDNSGKMKTLHRNHLFLVNNQEERDELVEEKINTDRSHDTEDALIESIDGNEENEEVKDGKMEIIVNSDVTDEDSDDDTELLVIDTGSGDAQCSVDFLKHKQDRVPRRLDSEVSSREDIVEQNRDLDIQDSGTRSRSIQERAEERITGQPVEQNGTATGEMESTEAEGASESNTEPEPELIEIDNTQNTPTPAPRRSTRERRMPKRYEDFQMYSIVTRPYDSKLQALSEVMESGILNNMDADIAKRLISSIFQ